MELKIELYNAYIAVPAHDGKYLAYIENKDYPTFLDYEEGRWYNNGIQMSRQEDVRFWGATPKATVQER